MMIHKQTIRLCISGFAIIAYDIALYTHGPSGIVEVLKSKSNYNKVSEVRLGNSFRLRSEHERRR